MKAALTLLGACAAITAVAAMTGAVAQQKIILPIPDFKMHPTQKKKEEIAARKPVYNKPVYNPETKSYFEDYSPVGNQYSSEHQYGWDMAKELAEKRVFHGARGRLAVIKTKETNDFIVEHFHPADGTWIGLQYLCDLNALRWSNGEFWPLTSYANWFQPWNREGTVPNGRYRAKCLPFAPWMGVHYWGPSTGYKWNANGTGKQFGFMIIEYPTGKP